MVGRLRSDARKVATWQNQTEQLTPLDASTVRDWFAALQGLGSLVEEACGLPRGSAVGAAAREHRPDIAVALDASLDAMADFVSFLESVAPPSDDIRGNAQLIRERRTFQRELRTSLRSVLVALNEVTGVAS
jgi:hypothetical protein